MLHLNPFDLHHDVIHEPLLQTRTFQIHNTSKPSQHLDAQTAATPKACYVCLRPTATVLATTQSVDFFYACDGHLIDPGFATQVGEAGDGVSGVRKLGLSEEEIKKVKEEWEERQRKKKEREKAEKEKAKEEDKDKDKSAESKDKKEKTSPSTPTPSPQPTPVPAPKPTHQRYTLHRDMFAMRLTVHRKRRQTEQAKKIAPKLPSAPHNAIRNNTNLS